MEIEGKEPNNRLSTRDIIPLAGIPGIEKILEPSPHPNRKVNDAKIRRLYVQASSQQWFAPQRIDYSAPVTMDEASIKVWRQFMLIFYSLEKMGLNTIALMAYKAVRKFKSDETAYYLAAQEFDEARHVFAIENYLKRLGAPPVYDRKLHVFGQIASLGAFRVENWLFSTLFSENFASAFLRMARNSNLDEQGKEMCRSLLLDESRHLHFLHTVLPDVMDRLGVVGKTYLKSSQYFIMKLTEMFARNLDKEAGIVGMNRKELVEDAFDSVQTAYENIGLPRNFVKLPKISPLLAN